jgi:hypothetical protein
VAYALLIIVNVLSFCYLVEPQNLSVFIVLEGHAHVIGWMGNFFSRLFNYSKAENC